MVGSHAIGQTYLGQAIPGVPPALDRPGLVSSFGRIVASTAALGSTTASVEAQE